jgi:gliding motility-associated-like protein
MNKKIVVFFVGFFQALLVFSQAGGADCNNLEPICTDVGISFTASSGVPDASTTSPGNNYDCLGSEPNPTWYYLEISNSGDVQMELNAASDIDFIIWGPFNSLTEAEANCGSYNNVVDCSYSFTNNETPEILGAVAGQVYVMLVTNYANVVQNITLAQSGGAGNTDCTIVNPPTANCPEYANQASSATETCGNQLYYLEVLNTACNGFVTFNIVGNYGSSYGSEITWEVVSNTSGNIVASGGPGTDGGSINVVVGPLDPSVEGTIFNLLVYDSWGDGFNGTGGIIQATSSSGTVLADIDGNFGAQSNQYFTSSIEISSATIDITTPSGVVSETMGNCQDFNVELTLVNNNFCTPISVDLPWEITCDVTGAIISNGTHTIMVYPQVPTQGSDVVSIAWNASSCSWDVSPNNDCDLLDLGTLFSISPDPTTLTPYCSNGTESFTVDYIGFASGPNCCQTAGPLTPITYNSNLNTAAFVASNAYAGTNNSAYAVVAANGVGGNAQSIVVDISGSGYCCPNCSASPEPYYIDVYIDGIQVLFEGPLTNSNFSYSFNEVDLGAYGVTYTQSSVIEVYVLPNNFWYGTPPTYTTFIPGASCGSLGAGQWTIGTLSTSVSAVFEQQTATPVSCSYAVNENYTCCSSVMALPPDESSSIACETDIFVPTPPTIMDNCGTSITPTMSENATPSCSGDKIYTFTYTDCTGASADWTYTFNINDNIPPTAPNPTNVNIAIAPAPAPDITVVVGEADNCTITPTVAFVSDVSDGNACPETITRTYSVTDDCGNETLVTQLIIIGGAPVPDPVVSANGPICEGGDAVFTITGVVDAIVTYDTGSGPSNVTLAGGTATITVPAVTTNTTITLINISDGSCNSAINLTATTTVNSLLIPTFDALGPYCQTGSVDVLLTSSLEGYTGSWSPSVIDNSTSGTGTYTFTADPGQCVANTTMDVIITDAPFVSAAALDSTLCEGDSTVLFIDTLSGGLLVEQFTMTFGSAFSYTTSNTNLPGNYYVVVSGTWSGSGPCELRDPAYIMYQGCNNITPIPSYIWKWNGQNPTSQSTTPYVYNPNHVYSFFFNGGSAQTFSFTESNPNWYNDNFGSLTFEVYYLGNISWSTGSTEPSDTIFPPVGTNTYSIILDYGNGCIATDDVTIDVMPEVTPLFTQIPPMCVDDMAPTLPLTSNNGVTGTWTPSLINTSTAGTITYTFTPDASQCALSSTMDIEVQALPLITITNNTGSTELTCTLIDISLTASGGDSYSWDNGLGSTSNVNINTPGNYTVTGYSVLGCESSAQIIITEDNTVDIIVNLLENEICSGEDAMISVSSTNATSFDWTIIENGVSGAMAGSGVNAPGFDILQTLIATGVNSGTVEYTITPLLGTCSGIPQTVIVNVNPPTIPVFTGLGPYCLDELIADNLNAISDNNIPGAWSPAIINTSTTGTTTYSFTPDIGECATGTTMDIVVSPLPTVSFSADNVEGCAPLSISLESSNATGNNIWTIGNGDILNGTNVSTSFTSPGCYDVTLFVQENGCSTTMTIIDYICVQNNPTAEFNFNPQTFTDVNQQVIFNNNSQGAVDYIWNFGEGSSSEITNPSHVFEDTEEGAIITLTAISEFGCTHSVEHIIPYDEQEIFYVPNTFTPDGDNFNQVFAPVFYSGFDPYNFSMLIFNRWGELIFETQNAEIGWDGSFGPHVGVVADGMYTWKITYKNPQTDERKILIGHVLVLR